MKNINSLTLKYIAFTIIIIVMLSIISLFVIKNNDNKQRDKLLGDAHIISAAIDIDGLKSLTAGKPDLSSPVYQRLKKQLFNIRTSNDSYKFLYLLGIKKDMETVFFFIDSQVPGSPDYVPPGEIYSEVPDEYIAAFKTKTKMTVGPVSDRWGTMITALIPIVDKKNGELIAVLGLDIIDNKWKKTIYMQSLPTIGFIAVVVLAVIILFLFRRKSTKEIKASEEKFRTIFENAPVLIDAFDINGKCVLWNKECEKIFGYSIEEVNRAKDPLALFYPDDEMRAEVIKSVVSEPDKKFREWNPHTKDGEILSVLWANFRVSDNLVINIGHNISESKKQQEEIEQERDTLARFKKVTINRELNLIKLKTEINELLEKLGKEARYKVVATKSKDG